MHRRKATPDRRDTYEAWGGDRPMKYAKGMCGAAGCHAISEDIAKAPQDRGPSPEAWRSCRPGRAASSGPDDGWPRAPMTGQGPVDCSNLFIFE